MQRLYNPKDQVIRILYLGDSYTCCEQEVNHLNKWPVRLAKSILPQSEFVFQQKDDWVADFNLQHNNKKIECKIIAKTGMRSDELYQTTLSERNLVDYNLVFILIGVNDAFQFANIELYKKNLQLIIDKAKNSAIYNLLSRVFVLSIPDWAYTPAGKNEETHVYRKDKYNSLSTIEKASDEIKQFNAAIREIVSKNPKTNYIDITQLTRDFGEKENMTQKDGLHYTHQMTDKWIEQILLYLRNDKIFPNDNKAFNNKPIAMRARL